MESKGFWIWSLIDRFLSLVENLDRKQILSLKQYIECGFLEILSNNISE